MLSFMWFKLVHLWLAGQYVRIYDETGYWTARIVFVGIDHIQFDTSPENELVSTCTRITLPLSRLTAVYENPELSARESIKRAFERESVEKAA